MSFAYSILCFVMLLCFEAVFRRFATFDEGIRRYFSTVPYLSAVLMSFAYIVVYLVLLCSFVSKPFSVVVIVVLVVVLLHIRFPCISVFFCRLFYVILFFTLLDFRLAFSKG